MHNPSALSNPTPNPTPTPLAPRPDAATRRWVRRLTDDDVHRLTILEHEERVHQAKASAKIHNIRTTDLITDMVPKIDDLVRAGDPVFGPSSIADLPCPPGAPFNFYDRWNSRHRQPETVSRLIDRFACQLNWLRKDGKAGYFNRIKHMIPVGQEFALLSQFHWPWVQSLADCGFFLRPLNGNLVRWCDDGPWCRRCNWTRVILPKLRSYPLKTWLLGNYWYGYTVSYETDPKRAHCLGRVVDDTDYIINNRHSALYAQAFVPPDFNLWGPPRLQAASVDDVLQYGGGIDDPFRREAAQYASRKFLGAVQHSVGQLVHRRILDGADQSTEVALGFLPFRMRWHVHGLACSRLHDDPKSIAHALKEQIDLRLARITDRRKTRRLTWPLNERLHANVMVVRFRAHDELLGWIEYMHKTVNYLEPVHRVYLRPENLIDDGQLQPLLRETLMGELADMRRWLDETFAAKFQTLADGDNTRRLVRTQTWHNLQFGDSSRGPKKLFIRDESKWHRERRQERAIKQKERREAKRQRRLLRDLAAAGD